VKWEQARQRDRDRNQPPLSSVYTVFVNKRSGTAHRKRDCEALHGVPDGALRRVLVESGLPRFRYCTRCSTTS
jgi:hypothetical protein